VGHHHVCPHRVFPAVKVRPGRDADPSPPSSAEVKNTSTLLKGLCGLWKGETYLQCKDSFRILNYLVHLYILLRNIHLRKQVFENVSHKGSSLVHGYRALETLIRSPYFNRFYDVQKVGCDRTSCLGFRCVVSLIFDRNFNHDISQIVQ
jgi:hypothetical protein